MKNILIAFSLFLLPSASLAEETEQKIEVELLEEGLVSEEKGLEHWAKIYEVFSHPRCANCHVDEGGIPIWSGPSYGPEPQPHGMNVKAGESRVGAETILCSTCHTQHNGSIEHAPPGAHVWHLPPPEMVWYEKSSAEICAQIQDPERNGERTMKDIVEHIANDELVHWGWDPGPGREPAPYSAKINVMDILAWTAAGNPCPQDEGETDG